MIDRARVSCHLVRFVSTAAVHCILCSDDFHPWTLPALTGPFVSACHAAVRTPHLGVEVALLVLTAPKIGNAT